MINCVYPIFIYIYVESIASMSKALLYFNMNDMCIQLQNKYELIMDTIEKDISQIWNYNSETGGINKIPTDFIKLGKLTKKKSYFCHI